MKFNPEEELLNTLEESKDAECGALQKSSRDTNGIKKSYGQTPRK
ncbi:hypothetical protein BTM423_00790 [Helicobacter pylori]